MRGAAWPYLRLVVVATIVTFIRSEGFAETQRLRIDTVLDLVDGNVASVDALRLEPGQDDKISLREALLAVAGTDTAEESDVLIDLVGLGAQRIKPLSPLPTINTPYVQIIADGAILDGADCGECAGLTIAHGRNLVEGLRIINFALSAIILTGGKAVENVIRGCDIGLLDGIPFRNGLSAIFVKAGASNNLIVDNVVAGNRGNGIAVSGSTSRGNKIYSNYIGLNRDLTIAVPNGYEFNGPFNDSFGIAVVLAPDTIVGGVGLGNLISSYHGYAIHFSVVESGETSVIGNSILANPVAELRLPDLVIGTGVSLISAGSDIRVGGLNPGEGNRIDVLFDGVGVGVGGDRFNQIKIQGNSIQHFGTTELESYGVAAYRDSSDMTIGPGNEITGFLVGVRVGARTQRISILQNAIYGNDDAGILFSNNANGGLLAAVPDLLAGTAQTMPCVRVDYYADEEDEGRYYLGSRYADADGSFPLIAPEDVPANMNITTIVTDRYGNSSPFSSPVPVASVERAPLDTHPALGTCANVYRASADTDENFTVDLPELLRLIQLYNAAAYACDSSSEDGYAPGIGAQDCPPHSSDYIEQDWRISLSELLRTVQVFNMGGYYYCEDSEDGFCPGD